MSEDTPLSQAPPHPFNLPNPSFAVAEGGEHGDPTISPDSPLSKNNNIRNHQTLSSFEELVDWISQEREGILHANLIYHTHLIDFSPLTLTVRLLPEAPKDLPRQLEVLLKNKRGEAWTIAISDEIGHPTLHEKEQKLIEDRKQALLRAPLVKLLMDNFPGTTLIHNEDR